jgi:branched-chain amino acid transport system ATP-binding protein
VRRDLDFVYEVFPILRERSGQDAATLSGGQQQMCAIGRGVMARPKLLMIDELSLGLAPRAVEELADSLARLNAEGVAILLVEQDVMTAFEIAQYGYVLESGRVALHGTTRDLRDDPKVQRAYMGL